MHRVRWALRRAIRGRGLVVVVVSVSIVILGVGCVPGHPAHAIHRPQSPLVATPRIDAGKDEEYDDAENKNSQQDPTTIVGPSGIAPSAAIDGSVWAFVYVLARAQGRRFHV